MTDEKSKQLKAKGFKAGSVAEFLELTQEEQAMIDNVIIRNGKPIGVCECSGKGKEICKGNGWVKNEFAFQTCPYFQEFK